MFQYYNTIEQIITLELSIAKYSFSSPRMIEMENSINNGLPYYVDGHENYGIGENSKTSSAMHDLSAIVSSGKAIPNFEDTATAKRISDTQEHHNRIEKRNAIATSIINKMFLTKKLKSDIGDELYHLANKVKHLLKQG